MSLNNETNLATETQCSEASNGVDIDHLIKKRKICKAAPSKAGSFIGVSAMDYSAIEHGKIEITVEQYQRILKGFDMLEAEMTIKRK